MPVDAAGPAAVTAATALCHQSRRRTPATARVCPPDTSEQRRTAE